MGITTKNILYAAFDACRNVGKILPLGFELCSCFAIILLTQACSSFQEIRENKSLSNFTLSRDSLFFGGGYHLYRLDLSTYSLERIFSTNRIRVEQPVIAEGIAYFGGRGCVNKRGFTGDNDTFFALDLQSRDLRWSLDLDRGFIAFLTGGGYGTFGTYPVVAGDRILVCARQHLYCLNRHSGKVLWKIDTWLGDSGGGPTRPYVFRNFVYYKISEEDFTGSTQNDGHWAVVELASGKRHRIIPIAEKPGTFNGMEGHGSGTLVDGVLYLATREPRFGAIELKTERLLWEFNGKKDGLWQFSQYTPAVNDKLVFTAAGDSVFAFDRATGDVVWKTWVGEISPVKNFEGYEWKSGAYQVRFAAANAIVVARGFTGVGAWRADSGEPLWTTKSAAGYADADPLIVGEAVIVSCAKEGRVFALDLNTGQELWSIRVPDCTYYKLVDKS